MGLAKQRGYDQQFGTVGDADLLEQASLLLRYVRARHDQTLASLADVFEQVLDGIDASITTIILLEGEKCAWTSGVWLEELDAAPYSPSNPFGEIWFNPSSEIPPFTRARYRSYMWGKGRYQISDFFQFTATAGDSVARHISGVGRFTQEDLRQLVLERSSRVLGHSIGGQALLGLAPAPARTSGDNAVGRVGIVGIALDSDFMEKFVSQLRIVPGLADRNPARRRTTVEATPTRAVATNQT